CAGAGGAAAWALREIQAVETPRCQAASSAARGSRPASETLLLPIIERSSAARIASVFQTWVRYTNPKTENSNQVEHSICRAQHDAPLRQQSNIFGEIRTSEQTRCVTSAQRRGDSCGKR